MAIDLSMETLLKEKKTDIATLMMRLALGTVIFGHGAQKLFGWFGGYGLEGTMNYFISVVEAPYLIGMLVILGESFGAIALVLGLFSRFMAASILFIMVGAMAIEHAQFGFFMNWFGNQKGEGIEFDLLVFGISLALIVLGGGTISLDQFIANRISAKK